MKFDDKTICEAINISWTVASKAENLTDSIRRWQAVANELQGIYSLLLWAACNFEDKKVFNEISPDILYLKRLAEFNAYGI